MKTGINLLFYVIFFVFFLFSSVIHANPSGKDKKDFFDLDLSELSNIIVTVASTKKESLPGTPAVVSRYEADEMASMGLRTLKDMLSFIPGVVVQDSGSGTSPIMIRGLTEAFNQKVLFLIDDVPYWQPAHSDIPLLGVPLEMIHHVEVIRGPGAVYYGTNASAGVIKVVTKKGAGNRLSFSAGTNSLFNGGGYLHQQLANETDLSIGFEVQDEDGYGGHFENVPIGSFPPTTPTSGTIEKMEKVDSVMGRLTYKNLNLLAQYYQSENNGLSGPGTLINESDLTYVGYLTHLDYLFEWDKFDLKVFTDYNNFYPLFEAKNFLGVGNDGGARFEHDGEDNYRWRSGITSDYAWTDSLRFFGGWEYEIRSTGDYTIFNEANDQNVRQVIQSDKITERAVFGQLDYTLGDRMRFLIGGRHTNNDKSGKKFVPRISGIYKLDEKQSVKLLYSRGFNSPNFIQQGVNDILATTPPDLKAEIVGTVDLAYSLVSEKNLFVANLYYLRAQDVIERRRPAGQITFFNGTNFVRYGAELDYQREAGPWKVFTNLSFHFQGNDIVKDDELALYAPKLTGSLGGFYQIGQHHRLGGSLRFIDERAGAADLALLNLDYQYQRSFYTFYITLRNILDEDIQHPDVQNLNPGELIPSGDGVNILAGVKLHF